jgi:hypothetical protein
MKHRLRSWVQFLFCVRPHKFESVFGVFLFICHNFVLLRSSQVREKHIPIISFLKLFSCELISTMSVQSTYSYMQSTSCRHDQYWYHCVQFQWWFITWVVLLSSVKWYCINKEQIIKNGVEPACLLPQTVSVASANQSKYHGVNRIYSSPLSSVYNFGFPSITFFQPIRAS